MAITSLGLVDRIGERLRDRLGAHVAACDGPVFAIPLAMSAIETEFPTPSGKRPDIPIGPDDSVRLVES